MSGRTGTALANPYLEAFERVVHPLHQHGFRRDLVKKYAWSIPTAEAVQAVVDLGEPVISVGAGTGYWESLISAAGGDIVAFDSATPDVNHWHKDAERHFDVQVADAVEAIEQSPRPVLFLSWPPYADPMGADAVAAHFDGGGRYVVYVGEGFSGCTGDDMLHRLLGETYCAGCNENYEGMEEADEELHSCHVKPLWVEFDQRPQDRIHIPQWYGIHDSMSIYERKE